jgi:hypothetical protein
MLKPLFKYNCLKINSLKSHDFGTFFSQKSFVWIRFRYENKHGTLPSEEKNQLCDFHCKYEDIKFKQFNTNKNKIKWS